MRTDFSGNFKLFAGAPHIAARYALVRTRLAPPPVRKPEHPKTKTKWSPEQGITRHAIARGDEITPRPAEHATNRADKHAKNKNAGNQFWQYMPTRSHKQQDTREREYQRAKREKPESIHEYIDTTSHLVRGYSR